MNKDLLPSSLSIGTPQRGKVSNPRVPTDVVNFITLDDLMVRQAIATEQLAKMRKLEESKVPVTVKTISMSIGTETVDFAVDPPWISFSLINDGASAMTAWVNEPDVPQSTSMIANGGTLAIDMTYPVIRHLYMKSAGTSAVRIYAKEGKV